MNKSLQIVPSFPSEMGADMQVLLPKYFAEELSGLSPLTLKVRRTDLTKFVQFYNSMYGNLNAKNWYPRDSRLFLDELGRQGYAPSYRNRNLASIKSFGRWLWEYRYVDHDPVKGLREIQIELQPKVIDERQLHRFYKIADRLAAQPTHAKSQGFRNAVLAQTLEASGLRIEEVLSLTLEQFVGNRFLNVKAKGGKVRSAVSIKKEVADLIRCYIRSYRTRGSNAIFTNRYGTRLSRNGVAQALNKIAALASSAFAGGEMIKVSPHRFRHSHAKKLYDSTKDPVLVARRLGNGIKYVSRYATASDSEIDSAIEKI